MHTFSRVLRILNPLCYILIHKIANIKSEKKKKGQDSFNRMTY